MRVRLCIKVAGVGFMLWPRARSAVDAAGYRQGAGQTGLTQVRGRTPLREVHGSATCYRLGVNVW